MKLKILLLDDHSGMRRNIQLILEELGHEATPVGSIPEFEKAYQPGQFDLVVTDLNLQEKNAGLHLARRMKKEQQKVILMSSEDLGHIKDVTTITKTSDLEEWKRKIDQALS